MELDMTKGKPSSLILKFIWPVLLGNVFQQLYNMVDTIIVGRCVGFDALAAVGATGTILFLILGFAMGLTTGFTVITSQKFGAGDHEAVKISAVNSLLLSVFVVIILTFASVAGMPTLLRWMHTPEDIFGMSLDYITIICYGLGFTVLYNILASLLRAVGNSKTPLYFLVISAVLNIVLDLVLIRNFGMGVKGAALATIISQAVSGILCFIYILFKVPVLVPDFRKIKIDTYMMGIQLKIGIPMALQYSITAVGTIIVQAALNLLGSVAVASYTAANKVSTLVTLPYSAFGVTMATYSAQNRGVNDIDRIQKGNSVANHMSFVYSILIFAVAMPLLPVMLKLFVDSSSGVDFDTVLGYARTYMIISGINFTPLGVIFILRNTLQGCGFSMVAMFGGVVELVSRVIIAFIASSKMSFAGVCAADGLTWLITGIYFFIVYMYKLKQMRRDKMEFENKNA